MERKFYPRLITVISGTKRSIKDPQKTGGREGGDTIHLILIAPQIQIRRLKHLNLTVSQTRIYHHHLIVVHQVMINARRERDPGEIEIDAEKGGTEEETKDANGGIGDQSTNQKGCIKALDLLYMHLTTFFL